MEIVKTNDRLKSRQSVYNNEYQQSLEYDMHAYNRPQLDICQLIALIKHGIMH